jgi:predicted DNA-binding transcriptional regulator AlpA
MGALVPSTGPDSTGWRISDVARHLGVSRQRAQHMAHAGQLPRPVSVDAVGPVWNPDDIRPWAERWESERRWRRLAF